MNLNTPFFVINPKNFLGFEEISQLAEHANKLAKELKLSIFFTAPSGYLHKLSSKNESLIITAQDVFVHENKDTMGKVSFSNLEDLGVNAIVLNHADSPLTISEVIKGIHQANANNIISIVCANSILEAKMIALCNPTILLAEETDLIGGSEISGTDFLENVTSEVKSINPNILVEYGAGIRTPEDVEELLKTGVDGVGVTSGIVKAENPLEMIEKMLLKVKNRKDEIA